MKWKPRTGLVCSAVALTALLGLFGAATERLGASVHDDPVSGRDEFASALAEDEPATTQAATEPADGVEQPVVAVESNEPTTQPSSAPAAERGGRRDRGGRGGGDSASQPTLIISNGRILTMDAENRVINGTVTIRDGQIATVSEGGGGAMGGGRRPNPFLTIVDAKGRYVTPGLVDAWSSAGVTAGGPSGGGKASLDVRDAIDGFRTSMFSEAIKQGVTALCVEPSGRSGVAGLAALVRLQDLSDPGALTTEHTCLVIRVGMGRVGPFARLGEMKSLRELFRSAKEYREGWEEYDEALEKYEKDLKSGKTVKLSDDAKPAGPKTTEKPEPPPSGPEPRRGRRPRPPRDDSHEGHDHGPVEVGDGDSIPNAPRCPQHPWVIVVCCCPEDHSGEANCEHDHPETPELPSWLTLDVEPGKTADKKDGKKGDEFKKPDKPARDPDQEVLVKALKRELRVRFEVHRPADILNVIDIAKEFNLDATISGGSGAGWVAEHLAAAEYPVLLSEFIPSASVDLTHTRDLSSHNVGRLRDAGVTLVIGSGAVEGGSRSAYLAQNAALAAGQGLPMQSALRAITIDAARLCGVADRIGSIEKGKAGDVVIWKGHPLAPDSVVEYVFVGGKRVYPSAP
ncbi:MAG: amidohydrolase family protein [Phycisphaerae bacterium]|nr:amidohydrolase family protein [Phycisphaerae bacterium]